MYTSGPVLLSPSFPSQKTIPIATTPTNTFVQFHQTSVHTIHIHTYDTTCMLCETVSHWPKQQPRRLVVLHHQQCQSASACAFVGLLHAPLPGWGLPDQPHTAHTMSEGMCVMMMMMVVVDHLY